MLSHSKMLTRPGAARTRKRRKDLLAGLLFVMPALLGFAIFVIGPMVASLLFSLTDYTVFNVPSFIGLDNYAELLSGRDPFFYQSLKVTFYYVVLGVPSFIAFSFLLAMLLNVELKGSSVFRAIFYIPSIVPIVASSMIWLWLFNPDMGLVNQLLSSVGLPTSLWFFSEGSVIPTLVLTGLWTVGGTMVIFLAGLQGIPEHYYEAVEVDGGNAFRKFIHITIPLMTPTIFFNTVMGLIGSFQTFAQAYILTDGGPNNASLFYVFFLWREAFRNANMGYASAIAWVLFIIILILTVVVFKSSKWWVFYEGDKDK